MSGIPACNDSNDYSKCSFSVFVDYSRFHVIKPSFAALPPSYLCRGQFLYKKVDIKKQIARMKNEKKYDLRNLVIIKNSYYTCLF
jgi:hypothetical protein